jgi:hypothetical protein
MSGATLVLFSGRPPRGWDDVLAVLGGFELLKSAIIAGGGGKSPISQAIERPLYARGWSETHFETSIVVDGAKLESPMHKADCSSTTHMNKLAPKIEGGGASGWPPSSSELALTYIRKTFSERHRK